MKSRKRLVYRHDANIMHKVWQHTLVDTTNKKNEAETNSYRLEMSTREMNIITLVHFFRDLGLSHLAPSGLWHFRAVEHAVSTAAGP